MHNIITKIAIFILFISLSVSLFSQGHEDHEHSRNEIGLSVGGAYSFDHSEWGVGTHFHYFRTLDVHSKWSLGGSLEQVVADGKHYNISAGAKYQALEKLSLGFMPGVTFLQHHEEGETHDGGYRGQFAIHTEIVYDLIHFDRFHLGPSFDYSWTKGDSHIMPGIHFAYCF